MKKYYMYLPLNIDKEKNTRFAIETDEIPTKSLFSGKVVARNAKAYHYLGFSSDNWVNPIEDLKHGQKPSFIPINKEELNSFDFRV
jgi:hypothetical protein